MEGDDYSTPVYLVTDQENLDAHSSPELESPTESEEMAFSDSSSQCTMATLSSSQVAGTSTFRSHYNGHPGGRNILHWISSPRSHRPITFAHIT